MQLIREINKNPILRRAGLMARIFETGRTEERQAKLRQQGKSWIKRSPHQYGSAFDLVLCYKAFKPLRITRFFWNDSEYYDIVSQIAVELGLYSYGVAYGKDVFHFELPTINQPASDCFAYAPINALRAGSNSWRTQTKKQAMIDAEILQIKAGRRHTLAATLDAAQALGWIKSYEEVDILDVDNEGCFVLQTRKRPLGNNPWGLDGKITEHLEAGKGIPGHAVAVRGWYNGKLQILNSHYNLPYYEMWDFSEVMKVFKISL